MKRLFLSLVISLFLISPSFAQVGLQQVRTNAFEGGMVSNSLPDILKPNQGASMANVILDRPGRLSKRKGQALFAEDVGNTFFRGIGRFDPDRTTSYLMAASGTNVIRAISSASQYTLSSPSSIVTAGQNTEFVQANDLLFVLNGFDNTGWFNGSSFNTGGVYPASPPSARTGAWLRNYLFLGGATTETDWVYFSNNLEPTVYDASDIIKINTGDGQAIQRMVPYRLNELIIYKERSVFVLDITGSTPITDWTVQPISTVVGTIAQRSVVSLGNDQWFLSSEPIAIRSLARTSFDKILVNRVSEPIQDIFDRTGPLTINTTHINKAAGVLFNDKYILAIATGTSTVNNTLVVHDFNTQGWYIITGWFCSDFVVFDKNRLFCSDANDGRVLELFTGTTGDFLEGPNFIDSTSVPSVGIEYTFQSRSIDFDKPEVFKKLDSIEVEFDPTGNYNAEAYINLDNSGWDNIGTVNLAGDSLTLDFTLPGLLSDSGQARKTFQLDDKGSFKKMSVMIQHRASSQTVSLQRVTIFSDPKTWRREGD